MTDTHALTVTPDRHPDGKAPFEPQPGEIWAHRVPRWRVEVLEVTQIGRYRTVIARRLESGRITDPSIDSFMFGYWPEPQQQ